MPKVGSELIRAHSGSKYHTVDINFYKKSTQFKVTKLPEGFDTWHKKEISAETYDEVVQKATKLIREYWDASVTQRKMISYKIDAHKSEDAYPHLNLGSPSFRWNRKGSGPALYVEYKIYWEVIMGGKKFYSEKPYKPDPKEGLMLTGGAHLSNAEGHDFRDKKFAPHTDELEEFFSSLKKSMNGLVDKVEAFFDVEPELLENKIKNSNLLQ